MADLDIVMLLLGHRECKNYGDVVVSTQSSEKGLRDQAVCDRVVVPIRRPKQVLGEDVRISLKL